MREAKKEVEEDEKNGMWPNNNESAMKSSYYNNDPSQMNSTQMGSISLVEKEKKMFEKIKRR